MASTRIVPVPDNEDARMRALGRLQILDTAPERAYDDIVELASAICATPIAAMTLIDGNRQWFKAKVGIPFDETPREEAFCAYAILSDGMTIVPDASIDDRFSEMMAVKHASMRFYASSTIRSPDGFNLGTLCVLDVETRQLTDAQTSALQALRRMVESQLELRRVNLELVRLEKQKRELTELVVHDLKNPIASILPNARWLAKAGLPEKAHECAEDIATSAHAMHRLVLDLLDISRAEDAMLVPNKTGVDVATLVEEVRTGVAARVAEQGSELSTRVTPDVGVASLDRDLVRRVLENLTDNALKYAAGGRVTIEARLDGNDIVFAVSDEGPGVPPPERERIFEKYARLGGSPHADRSRGLGLAFCRIAIEAHAGRVWVEDAVPRGARFVARVPR